jgi:hypothetical protein
MKQKKRTVLFILLVTLFISSCVWGPSVKGNGNVIEEQRKTGSFDEIKVTRGINVYISQGETQKIVVEADENLIKYIETRIEDNALKITTSANIRNAKSKKVFVTVTGISGIHSTAGSNVYSETDITCDDLEISSSAGSNIKLSVNTRELDVSANAGSNVFLEGNSEKISAKASSGANIKAEELTTNDCKARASSGANIWITVKSEFDGNASSGGNVYYQGEPRSINIESSSGGNVRKK